MKTIDSIGSYSFYSTDINADFNASINIALIGEHEVHDPKLIKRNDSIGWFSTVFKTKTQISNRLENIVLKEAFQRSRLQLVPA